MLDGRTKVSNVWSAFPGWLSVVVLLSYLYDETLEICDLVLEASGRCVCDVRLTEGYVSGRHRQRTVELWILSLLDRTLVSTLALRCTSRVDTPIPQLRLSTTNSTNFFSRTRNCCFLSPVGLLSVGAIPWCSRWFHIYFLPRRRRRRPTSRVLRTMLEIWAWLYLDN